MTVPSFSYRQVIFKIEVIGTDIWRWTIPPRRNSHFSLIGQFRGSKEEAILHCRAEIDGVIALGETP